MDSDGEMAFYCAKRIGSSKKIAAKLLMKKVRNARNQSSCNTPIAIYCEFPLKIIFISIELHFFSPSAFSLPLPNLSGAYFSLRLVDELC